MAGRKKSPEKRGELNLMREKRPGLKMNARVTRRKNEPP